MRPARRSRDRAAVPAPGRPQQPQRLGRAQARAAAQVGLQGVPVGVAERAGPRITQSGTPRSRT